MDYLSTVRVLDTDYKIKDEEAARINHTHKVDEIDGAAKEGHKHQASEIAGLSTVATSGSYSDLSGKPSAATESADGLMTSADKKKLDGIQAGASSYTHPTHTAHASGLYKVAVDSLGHVSSATAVTKSDITALGIPAQDTNTTYGEATANAAGLMSAADKKKLDGIAAGAQANTVTSVNGKTGAVKLSAADVGAAASSHTHDMLSTLPGRPTTADFSPETNSVVHVMLASSSMKVGKPESDGYIVSFEWDWGGWAAQLFVPSSEQHHAQIRVRQNAYSGAKVYKWSAWKSLCYTTELVDASVKAAETASKLATARTIALTGAVTGSAKFDGSGNVSISTTANESYISSPISGLYNMAVDADGNLWVYHSDSDKAPNFEYDSSTGNLYYVTEA